MNKVRMSKAWYVTMRVGTIHLHVNVDMENHYMDAWYMFYMTVT